MNTNQKFVKSLAVGETYTTPNSRGTVYRAERVRVSEATTTVVYTVPGSDGYCEMTYPSLTTITLV